MDAAVAIETPSGKGAGDENFPVGSLLLPPALRPHVAVYYAFARTIDDIADNPKLSPEQKIARLSAFRAALYGENPDPGLVKAHRLRESMLAKKVPLDHGRDLIAAFLQDATKLRYRDWKELMAYCAMSASPVGRFLLDLHGEDRAGFTASDALCNALQVLNHLQDCKADNALLNRVYLPTDWMEECGASVQDLSAAKASPGLRKVIDKCLDGVDQMIVEARRLPGLLKNRRLAMESAAIIFIAEKLSLELRRRDPIAGRVQLGKPQFLWCCLRGIVAGFLR